MHIEFFRDQIRFPICLIIYCRQLHLLGIRAYAVFFYCFTLYVYFHGNYSCDTRYKNLQPSLLTTPPTPCSITVFTWYPLMTSPDVRHTISFIFVSDHRCTPLDIVLLDIYIYMCSFNGDNISFLKRFLTIYSTLTMCSPCEYS